MKTSKQITKAAFQEWFDCYMKHKSHSERMFELLLNFENNDSNYYYLFMKYRRMKAHSAAFYSVILAIKPFLSKGYYASNEQIKQNIKEFFGMTYKEFLADLVRMIDDSRNEYLEELKKCK